MIRGIYTAASGMVLKADQQKVIANNLANVNTTGFKKDGLFRRTLIDCDLILSAREIEPAQGAGKSGEIVTDFRQGELLETGNQLDIALHGDGFFVVETPEGERYTRKGSFALDNQGQLVTPEGHTVSGEGGPITIRGTQVSVTENGEVIVDDASAGRLKVVDFERPLQLVKAGGGLFAPLDSRRSGEVTAENVRVMQGYLENSNVRAVEEMVKMIEIFREFEAAQRSVQLQDETVKKAIAQLGRVEL